MTCAVDLAVIVPAFGNWFDTAECLRLLVEQASSSTRIYLVDDGSPEKPPPEVLGIDRMIYLRGDHVGFAANCNRSADVAIRPGATHVLFLNNDTRVGPQFIEAWHDTIRGNSGAIMSPIIHYSTDPSRIWHSGGSKAIGAPFVRQRLRPLGPMSVDLVCGCCLLVPAKVWSRLGGFDEGFPMYFEDFDLSLRAKEAGVMVMVLPDSRLSVLHTVSGTFRDNPWHKERLLIRGRRRFVSRHYSGVAALACRLMEWPHFLCRLIANGPTLPGSQTLLGGPSMESTEGDRSGPASRPAQGSEPIAHEQRRTRNLRWSIRPTIHAIIGGAHRPGQHRRGAGDEGAQPQESDR